MCPNIGDANLENNPANGEHSIPLNDAQDSAIWDQGNEETNSLATSLNQLSLSQENIERLSRNFTKSRRYEGDMDDKAFDLKCHEFLRSLQLSPAEMDSLEKRTIDGNEIEEWHVEIRKRLPATAFGRVFLMLDRACRNNLVTNLLSLASQKELSSNFKNAIEYMVKNERKAIAEYENFKKQSVKPCGLFVHPKYAFLVASPEGLIGDNGILLIKFPYYAQSKIPYTIPSFKKSFCCITVPGSTQLRLKRRHPYYYQIQGMLEITGRKFCDFVIWTQRGIHVERISRNKSVWKAMLPTLETFYKLSLLPEIINPRIPRGFHIREPDFVVKAKNAWEKKIKNNGNNHNRNFQEQMGVEAVFQNVEQLSKNYTKSKHYPSDMGEHKFNLDCQQFLNSLQLSSSAIDALQMQTSGLLEINVWREERRKRLFASKFGRVFLLQDFTSRNRLVTFQLAPRDSELPFAPKQEAIHRINAVEAYRKYAKVIVKPCGMFVHPRLGYLCASPDGLVGDDGLVEVKCPTTTNRTYLKKIYGASGDVKIRLHKNHDHFYKIQGQLEIAGRRWCDFVVWTQEAGIEYMERIYRDKSVWNRMLPKLKRFYKLSLLPELVDPRIPRGLPIREPDFVVQAIHAMEMRPENNGNRSIGYQRAVSSLNEGSRNSYEINGFNSVGAEAEKSLSNPNFLDQLVINFEQLSKNYTRSEHYPSDKDEHKFNLDCQQFLDALQLSSSAIDALQMQTIGQVENYVWREEKRKRLFASYFGPAFVFLDFTLRNRFVKFLLAPRGSELSFAAKQGVITGTKAVEAYRKDAKVIVKPCGMFVHPQFGYLCASPNGLVGDDGILDVKCPTTIKRHFLKKANCKSGGEELMLRTNHDHFYKIQGQLEVTGREWCDFVVWTKEAGIEHMERIYRDKSVWELMFPKLERFYKLSLLPELVDPRIPRDLPIREPDFVVEAMHMPWK